MNSLEQPKGDGFYLLEEKGKRSVVELKGESVISLSTQESFSLSSIQGKWTGPLRLPDSLSVY